MYSLLRTLLFRLDPETAHQFTLQLLRLGGIEPIHSILRAIYSVPSKPVDAFGLTFKNPLGIAAGYDKNAIAIKGLSALGFGHIEVGTVTLKPQPGNPRPRVFRLLEDEAVINRMGFPSKGMQQVSRKLLRPGLDTTSEITRSTRPAAGNEMIIGVNLGKNKDTPLDNAVEDYISLMKTFASLADYLTINISSPNTVGLRRLQGREMLENLLGGINLERETLNLKDLPILVKISPDLNAQELDDAIGVILDKSMDGIIATNTTLAREGLRSKYQNESGGLSGSPLRVHSEAVLDQVVKRVNSKIPIISVGGIMNPDDAKRRLDMGATLIQLYSGLIYQGPGLGKRILDDS
ncbi:MAG TPA: quinone-dependent dihydroorotate dehydrogenase [Anaerolineales bacterium]|nr:quinone-dependent dihydroorotate dehydrogenase [Anaerolineales bacterium]